MRIGVLALQGAFAEHIKMLETLGADCIELRQKSDLNAHIDGLVLPGGESTVQSKLLRELDMLDTLKSSIEDGMPTLGTCAGLILLAEEIAGSDKACFGTMSVTVKRNAYGRQLGSFYTEQEIKGIGKYPCRFIRAPYIESIRGDAEELARIDGHIVGAKCKNQIGLAFHPELTTDTRIHEMFLKLI